MLFFIAAPSKLLAQWSRPDSAIGTFLITAGPGDEVFTLWGHSALVITNGQVGRDFWYDYGIVQGGSRETAKALSGRFRAHLIRSESPRSRLAMFVDANRSVAVQEIRLTAAQQQELIRLLNADLAALADSGYAYNILNDNCTSRIRDLIDRVTGGAIRREAMRAPPSRTVREHAFWRFSLYSPVVFMIADFLAGPSVDRPMTGWQAAVIPAELAALLRRTTVDGGEALTVERYAVTARRRIVERPSGYHWPLLFIGLALGIVPVGIACALRTRARTTALGVYGALAALALGVPGLLLGYMMAFSAYSITAWNANLLLANPVAVVTLPLWFAYAKRSRRCVRWLSAIWAAVVGLGIIALAGNLLGQFEQDNSRLIALMMPVSVGIAIAMRIASARGTGVAAMGPEHRASYLRAA